MYVYELTFNGAIIKTCKLLGHAEFERDLLREQGHASATMIIKQCKLPAA